MPTATSTAEPRLPSGATWTWLVVGLSAVLATAVRWPALFTDFWLDEIWSYDEFARRARSIADILFNPAFKHDNNQVLNTIVLWLIGDERSWFVYRLPALTAGVLAVVVAVATASRRNRTDGWLTGTLLSLSFLMVVYSTEARGYAWLIFFSLASFESLRRYLASPSLRRAAWFWLWIALGLSAHTTIAHFYMGALLWSGFRLRQRFSAFVRLHAVPLVWTAAWGWFVLRDSVVGGGPRWSWATLGDQSLAWTLGYPTGILPAATIAVVAATLVLVDAVYLWREEASDEGLFYVGVILGPPLLIAALNPPWLFPRYFLVSLAFLLVVIARELRRMFDATPWGRVVAIAAVAGFCVGNGVHLSRFYRDGRGGASAAIDYMLSHSSGRPSLVTGEPVDVWTRLPLAFYARLAGGSDRLTYVPRADVGRQVPATTIDWLVIQNQDAYAKPALSIALAPDATFVLKTTSSFYGPSGMNWFLYQRAGSSGR